MKSPDSAFTAGPTPTAYSPFRTLAEPIGEEELRLLGLIAIRHAHLDLRLKLLIKTLSGVSASEVYDALEGDGSALLRDRVRKHARAALGESAMLLKVQALMRRCKVATIDRNEVMHEVCCRTPFEDTGERFLGHRGERRFPKLEELLSLAQEIERLVNEIEAARQGIEAAMRSRLPRPTTG